MGTMSDQIADLLGGEQDETISEESSDTVDTGEETGQEDSSEIEEGPKSSDDEEVSKPEGEEKDDTKEEPKAESTEKQDVEEETSSDDSLSEVERLRNEVNRLAALVGERPKENEVSESSESSEDSDATPIDALSNYSFDDIVESEETFKSWAADFASQIERKAHENILQKLPDTVSSYVEQQVEIRDQVKDFYTANPELAEAKKYVSVIANQIASENPDLNFSDVLEKTAEKARETLGLKKVAKEASKKSNDQKSPGFAKASGGSASKKKGQPTLTDTERQIQELMMEDE